jgi:uncharacterized protein (DUF885 family)
VRVYGATRDEAITSAKALALRVHADQVAHGEAAPEVIEGFDLRQFHDRVLEDGNVNLPMLRAKVERWIAEPR